MNDGRGRKSGRRAGGRRRDGPGGSTGGSSHAPSPDLLPPEGWVRLGRLGRSVGLEGALRFGPDGPAEAEAVFALEEAWVEGLGVVPVLDASLRGERIVLRLGRVRRVERAKELANAELRAPAGAVETALAGADPDEGGPGLLARHLVIGRPVRLDGESWGEVRDLIDAGAQQLLVLDGPAGEALVPAAAPYVRVGPDGVDLVDPPEGLLDG